MKQSVRALTGVLAVLALLMVAPTAYGQQQRGGNFVCDNPSVAGDWTYVSNAPSDLVIGNCREGWGMNRSAFYANSYNWDGGYIFGDFNGCGWVRADWDRQVGNVNTTSCWPASRNRGEFVRVFSNTTGCGAVVGQCNGQQVTTIGACDQYANVRPWSANSAPTNYLRTTPRGWSNLYWRYVTKDNRFVLVQDTSIGQGQGNWVFVPRGCLPADLPGPKIYY